MNLFDLQAKLTLDTSEYDKGLDGAEKKTSVFGDVLKANLVGKGIEVAVKGMANLGKATVDMVSRSVKAYANYEQLVGGVEKLYGEAAESLQAFANQAYKTSGMSANQYMETATSFSAALVNSLGGDVQTAANMTDVAMRAMSDNVNTFGSSMESVENAFKGFSKQNFTMLDNLKLGYGGTKEEMERLLRDAEKYEGYVEGALDVNNFADIIDAIQIVQEHLNVAGTTNREAMSTIEGSATATKAAWENVITAIGRGEGLSDALNGLTTSIFGDENGGGLLNNLIPRIQTTMESIGEFISTSAPLIADKIPALIEAILPSVLSAGASLVSALGQTLLDNLPWLLEMGTNLITSLMTSMAETVPTLLPQITDAIIQIAMALTEPSNISAFISAGVQLFTAIILALPEIITKIVKAIPEIISNILQGFKDAWPSIKEAGVQIFTKVKDGLASVKEKISGVVESVKENMAEKFSKIKENAEDKFNTMRDNLTNIFNNIKDNISDAWQKVYEIPTVKAIFDWISETFNNVKDTLANIWDGIRQYAEGAWELIKTTILAPVLLLIDLITGDTEKFKEDLANIWNKIKESASKIWEGLKKAVTSIVDGFVKQVKTNIEGFGKILKTLWDGIKNKAVEIWTNLKNKVITTASNLISGVKEWIQKLPGMIQEKFTEAVEFIKNLPSKALSWGKDMIDNFISGITSKIQAVKDAVGNVAGAVRDFIGFSEPEKGPLSNFHTFAPDMMSLFIKGIEDNEKRLTDAVAGAFDFENLITAPTIGASNNGVSAANVGGRGNNYYTINVNQPVSTPADMLREIRTEAQYGLMIGEALA